MPEVAYIQTTMGTRFPVIPKDEVPPPNTTCYEIGPRAGDEDFPEDFPLKYHVLVSKDQSHVLDSVKYMITLDQWLKQNDTIDKQLFHVKVSGEGPLHQIVRPTNKGLAMIRALLKVVGRFHWSCSVLSYPVDFGVNGEDDEEDDPEYEIVLIEGATRKYKQYDNDYVRHIIFDKILKFPEGGFINFNGDLESPRLPAGLSKLEYLMPKSSLNRMAYHYSILGWKHRKALLDAQYDMKKCGNPGKKVFWIKNIPPTGIVNDYFENQQGLFTRTGRELIEYKDEKVHLLRFMRHFSNHVRETQYHSAEESAKDFKSDEYVECVFSEIFHEHYSFFFP